MRYALATRFLWPARLLVVAVAAVAGAATAVVPEPYPKPVIVGAGPTIGRGFAPEFPAVLPDDGESVSILYVTRNGSGIYESGGSIEEFLGGNGRIRLPLLMSLARRSKRHLPQAYMAAVAGSYTSVVVLRNHKARTDTVFPFREVSLKSVPYLISKARAWRGGSGREIFRTDGRYNSTIIFLGGTDGGVLHPALFGWAEQGARVIAVPWVDGGSKTPGCLDRVDIDLLTREIEEIFQTHREYGPVSIVGYSGGADAALMIANRSNLPFHSLHAIAPTAWHFNGDRGPACLLPSSPWSIDGQPVPYILNFATDWAAPINLARRAAGSLSQNTVALGALKSATPRVRKEIEYDVSNISVPTYLYAGGLDDLTPSSESLNVFCSVIANVQCYNYPLAGHDIFGLPAEAVFCKSPRESLGGVSRRSYCREMSIAREQVFNNVSTVVTRP